MQTETRTSIPLHLMSAAAEILGTPVLSGAPILAHGANNQVFRIETDTESFILKFYLESLNDRRNRFRAETAALSFMNSRQIKGVPKLVGCDDEHRIAIMEYVPGSPIKDASERSIDAAIQLISDLFAARKINDAENLDVASEACVAPIDLCTQIAERRRNIETAFNDHESLKIFVEQNFDPAFQRIEKVARQQLAEAGISLNTPLPRMNQTLSPSDFGFHNAVDHDGKITFLDFEYFGWDDPVRLVSDFLLHPGHDLDENCKDAFLSKSSAIFSTGDKSFIPRLEALYPLVGLRWCMILLNEFLPERLARRRAAGAIETTKLLLARQLKKSENLLFTLQKTEGVIPQ